jgi:hypothetical protein
MNGIDIAIERIHNRYNPERDTPADGVIVTWTDEQLAQCVSMLLNRLEELERKVEEMSHDASSIAETVETIADARRYTGA